ncbi:FAD dependent oxidoreductase superfamily [Fusarium longipes]|uniref:FAD dependent oxidoreductase superfamily n=1 Tax=Fusarium longipes TaxID=694270 RepID=A0A395T5Z0_9HYPO|nr:FAD dependent oxidoreductase superfamily [Fusarium longipes]
MSETGFPVRDPVDSYWQLPPHRIANHRSTPDLPSNVDHVIIGSGITGAVVAHELFERDPSASILMLEARTAASAASGRNGGHCRAGWWHRFPRHVEKYGEEEAVKIDNLENANVQAMADFVRLHNVKCDFKPVETAEVFKTKGRFNAALDTVKFRQAFRQRRPQSNIGINHRVMEAKESQEAFGIRDIVGATTYLAYTQNPYLLVCTMLEMSLASGLNLQTNTTVSKLNKRDGLWEVITQRGSVYAKNVVLATNAYTNRLYPDLAATGFLVPARHQVAAIRPGDRAQDLPALRKSCALADYNGGDYILVRERGLRGAGDMLYGGGEHLDLGTGCIDDSKINPEVAEYLHHAAADYVGQTDWGKEGQSVLDWVGITCYTPDSFPLVGEAPGQPGLWVSVGMNGHGMAFAYKCAEALVNMMYSEEPDWLPKSFRLERAFS